MNNSQRQSSSLFVAATPRKSAMGTSPRKSANHNSSSQKKSKGTPSSSSAKAKPQKKAPQIHQLEEDEEEMVGTSSGTAANGDRFARERSFPLTKVRHIMQSSPNSDEGIKMSAEAVSAMARAAEAFVEKMARGARHHAANKKRVNYNDLAEFVHTNEELSFVQDILPRKQRFHDVLRQIKKKNKQ